ncbi:HupE/UreJ family protein [Micropruina sp.]|uniref:HupE/UreJ family protein n=1 Tax=Micropruina sp. TaxID=2737536 RepID=UPI0039E53C3A
MKTWAQAVAAGLLAIAGALAAAWPASAHPMPHSVVALSVADSHVTAAIELPLTDLTLAMGSDPLGRDGVLEAAEADQVADYLAGHLAVTSPNGAAWADEITGIEASQAEQSDTGVYQELVAQVVLTPPDGESTRAFTLDYDAIIHQVITHRILVVVDSDWFGGNVEQTTEVGVIRVDSATGSIAPLKVELGSGSAWAGFAAMFGLGASHILEGTDHLLFLLVLLLPAPLLASRRRWAEPAPVRQAFRRILGITIAFTIGHSATLAMASLTRVEIPAAPVEALIAGSILVGALHALKPIFPGREALIAGTFGLVHGTAFSFTLAELHLDAGQLLLSLLGFNLGIEAMQLAVVALVLPALVLASQSRGYATLRVAGATLTAIAAIGWMLDRLGLANPIARLADGIVGYQSIVLAALWVCGLLLWTHSRRKPAADPLAVAVGGDQPDGEPVIADPVGAVTASAARTSPPPSR